MPGEVDRDLTQATPHDLHRLVSGLCLERSELVCPSPQAAQSICSAISHRFGCLGRPLCGGTRQWVLWVEQKRSEPGRLLLLLGPGTCFVNDGLKDLLGVVVGSACILLF